MLPAGFSHAIGGEVAGQNFFLAVRNTFLTVEEEPVRRRRRHHSWPPQRQDTTDDGRSPWEASGNEGGDDSDWPRYNEDTETEVEDRRGPRPITVVISQPNAYNFGAAAAAAEKGGGKGGQGGLAEDLSDMDTSPSVTVPARSTTSRSGAGRSPGASGAAWVASSADERESQGDTTGLSSDAVGSRTGPPSGQAFLEEVLRVTEELAEVARTSEGSPLAEVSQAGMQFNVSARLPREQAHLFDPLVALVSDSLFANTSRSRGVCLIGYLREPFVVSPDGFSSRLGTVQPKRLACRPFYKNGHCPSYEQCKWQHPESIVTITFAVSFDGEARPPPPAWSWSSAA